MAEASCQFQVFDGLLFDWFGSPHSQEPKHDSAKVGQLGGRSRWLVLAMGESSAFPLAMILLPFLFTLIVFIGCAFGARAIMRSKGRSGTSGFFLGLFLGVIGVIIAAALSADPEHEAEKFRKQLEMMGISPEQARFAPHSKPLADSHQQSTAEQLSAPSTPKPNQLPKSAAAVPVAGSSAVGLLTYALFDSGNLLRPLFFVLAFGLSMVAINGRSREMAAVSLGVRLSYQFGLGVFLALTGNTYFGWGLILGYLVSDALAIFGGVLAFRLSSRERSVRGANPFALVTAAVAVIAVGAITFGMADEQRRYGDIYSSGFDQERLAIVVALILPIIVSGLSITFPTRSRLVFSVSYCIMSILASTESELTSRWIHTAENGVAYLWTAALFATAVLGIYAIVSSQPDATSPILRREPTVPRRLHQ